VCEVPEQSPHVVYLTGQFENFIYEVLGISYLPHQVSSQFDGLSQLQSLASLADAIKLLTNRRATEDIISGDTLPDRKTTLRCLQSLIFIWATFKETEKSGIKSDAKDDENALYVLDNFLHGLRHIWANSDHEVLSLIWEDLAKQKENVQITLFVTMVTESLRDIGPRALRGVELCLLSYWNEPSV
jgi:hypothetical protein